MKSLIERANLWRPVNDMVPKVRVTSVSLDGALQAVVESSSRLPEDAFK